MKRWYFAAFVTMLVCAGFVRAADWPMFRGPAGNGVSQEMDVPTTWGREENVKWKVPLPRPGNGSPIVVGDRVFVTSAEDTEGRRRSLYCFDRANGNRLWVRTVEIDEKMPTHDTNPYCGTTPASDGKRVVVWHASAGLYCYDLAGNELWSRDLGEFRHMWGYGSSPVIYQDRVVLNTGPGKRVFVTAIDLDNGETIWQTDEPVEGTGDRNEAGKYMGSWSTPVIARVGGQDQIIAMLATRVNAYDPENGDIIWTCDGLRHDRGDLAYSSPIITDDLCFVTGGFRGPAIAIRLGGSGNITETHRLWRVENNPQNIGSGVLAGGYVYRPNAGPGTIECLDPKTGDVLWRDRAAEANHWGSIVMAGGLLYATAQDGTTVVFKPNPERYEEVARNQLGESCNTTPAISNGQIFIRTHGHLYCMAD